MPGKSPGPSIKWPEMYEKLIAQGKSKESAARISNAAWRKKRAKDLKKHTPGGQEHDQSTHGNWSRGTSGSQLADLVRSQQGFTVDPVTGKTIERGIPVAFAEFEDRHLNSVHPRHFSDYVRNHAEQWDQGYKLGGWALVNKTTGAIEGHVLDVVEVFDGEDYVAAFDAAVERGVAENQDAIFDLVNFEEIDLRSPGDSDAYRSRLRPDGSLTDDGT